MSTAWTITFDRADPERLAAFWCRALGYVEGTPPTGFATREEWLASAGVGRRRVYGGSGPTPTWHLVPEGPGA
jgi:Glyoxalase-like domain